MWWVRSRPNPDWGETTIDSETTVPVILSTYRYKLLEVGAMQRVMIITPTWASNKDIFAP